MTNKYCIVGATRGTGLLITQKLIDEKRDVKVLVRNRHKALEIFGSGVEVVEADVTQSETLYAAVGSDVPALFFTVEITGGMGGRGFFAPKARIRQVTYDGLVNTVEAAKQVGFTGRFVLVSVIGVNQPSLAWTLLNFLKVGLQQNIAERENYLKRSGLEFTIIRSPVLTNEKGGLRKVVIDQGHRPLTLSETLSREDLAKLMIMVADNPICRNKTFNVYSGRASAQDDKEITEQLKELS
jgi:uncharacterized protein YbjT (DUF2867 family)